MTELEADVDAREVCTVNSVGGGGTHKDFDVCIRGTVDSGRSKWGGTFFFEPSV
jgi:hypothetical protein